MKFIVYFESVKVCFIIVAAALEFALNRKD